MSGSTGKLGWALMGVVLGVFGLFAVHAPGAQSLNVAIINSTAVINGGNFPIAGGPFAAFNFTLLPVANVNAVNLAAFDTVLLNVASAGMGCTTATLTSSQKSDLVAFVSGGGKLIIVDSECATADYSWLPYPFTTNNPGALGAQGTLFIAEENVLSTSDSNDPHYIDAGALGSQSDAVGDMNVMTTFDPNWCLDMSGTNASPVTGPVHTYARYGNGLLIYNGLDMDYIGSNLIANGLEKIWLQELQATFNPTPLADLPCGIVVVGISLIPLAAENDVGTDHTVTATVTDAAGAPKAGVLVTFTVESGPNAGATGACNPADCTSGTNGMVDFTYTGTAGVGTDGIVACFTNTANEEICSQVVAKSWILSNACPARPHLGWNSFDVGITLTAHQPTYWSAATGQPGPNGSVARFPALDEAGASACPGRPDPDGSGERVLRGYLVAWAVNATGEEIRWNHLAGGATVINYELGSAWQYPAYAFQVVNPAITNGAASGSPGELFLDGVEYDNGFDLLLLDFYATGSQPFTQNGTFVFDTDLTLLPVDVDLRQETDGPVTTKASFTVWNMNETKFTGMDRCITCWDEQLLGLYEAPDYFLLENLQTEMGKAQIDGLASQLCDFDFDPGDTCTQTFGGPAPACDPRDVLSQAVPLLGVAAKQIAFSPNGPYEVAGMNLVGMGTQSATVRFDVISIPPERPHGHIRAVTAVHSAALAESDASPGPLPPIALAPTDRTSVSDKGSLLIYPKIELRWSASGTELIQDTFIDLVNDFPEDVSVQLYYVNGDPPTGP